VRLGARSTQRLTYQLRLALEPECLENPTATTREESPGMERTRSETLKLFVVSDVGRRSALLSSRRSTRWWQSSAPRSDAPSPAGCPWPQSGVELLERTGFARSHDGRTLEQILQIVIAVSVQSANRGSASSLVAAALDNGDRHCCASRCQIRCTSTAVAWCGNGAVSGSECDQ
jgi:hypothetical protein